jgi:predicted lipoprotein with Yx(FWY)xxD motif
MKKSNLSVASTFGVLALLLASCGGGDGGGSSADSASQDASQSDTGGGGTQEIDVGSTSLGDVLVDKDGRTLYMFTKDTKGSTSVCEGDCLAAWPPLGQADAGDGADDGMVGTITRSDGSKQATYDGWPLYYFAKDKSAGDVNGQGVGGVWYVLGADGTIVKKAPAGSSGQGGGY